MTDITPDKLKLAREWAEATAGMNDLTTTRARAAAEVVAALPDEWIDGDKLRETIEFHRDRLPHGAEEDLEALLPAPTPRTLADMTPEEREACQWMQCELEEDDDERPVIIWSDNSESMVVFPDGRYARPDLEHVVPLPDLPRMVWPDEHYLTTDEDVSIIPPEIDTSTGHDDHVDMTPQDAPEPEPGQAWLIDYKGTHYEAVYWYSPLHAHWSFTTSREGLTTIDSYDATPVSRLVPEVTG